MAWATVCNKHRILLQDCCPECGFLYSPTKLTGFERSMVFCHHCGHDMWKNPVKPAFSAIQSVIEKNKLCCFGQKCDMSTWLLTLDNAVCLIRRATLATHRIHQYHVARFRTTPTTGVSENRRNIRMVANLGTSYLIRSRGLRDKPTHVQFDSISSEKSCNKKHFTKHIA